MPGKSRTIISYNWFFVNPLLAPKEKKWYSHCMAKTKSPQHDDYFSQLASATEQSRQPAHWLQTEDFSGQLAVDVYDTAEAIIIRAAIAGVQVTDIDITAQNDMVTIKGVRRMEDEESPGTFLYQECYWGGFSRTVILPVDVDADQVRASLRNGILRVVLPKITPKPHQAIQVIDEDES